MTDETMGPSAEPVPDDPITDQSTDAGTRRGDQQTDDQQPLVDQPRVRTPEELRGALEALLLIADEPVSETSLAAALRVPTDDVAEAIDELAAFYTETRRGFELRRVAGGWRYYTREDYADLIGAYVLEGQTAKLSQAALETLAVIAYLQPVSRSRVSAVRGVNVDGVVRTLLARDLVTETGSEESGATLFRTTDYFLERMGLQSLDELPELAPYLPEATELEEELGHLAVVPTAADGGSTSDGSGSDEEGAASGPEGSDGPDRTDGSDSAGSDSAGSDSAGSDSAGSDSAGSDSAGSRSAGSDSAGSDSAGSRSAGSDSDRSDGSDAPDGLPLAPETDTEARP